MYEKYPTLYLRIGDYVVLDPCQLFGILDKRRSL